jgi:hypothetical protein
MFRARILLLGGCVGLLAALPAGAQFHQTYGRTYQFGELTSVAHTNPAGAIASGYFVDDTPQGMLLKVSPTGSPDWVRAYGSIALAAVRQTPAGYVWIGTGSTVPREGSTPVVAGVDPAGKVLWARRIFLVLPDGSPADQAYGSYLETDIDGGYWVGGEVWLHPFDDPQPWLGKLDSAGNLLWAKTLGVFANACFYSIFPAFGGGIIGVGQIWALDNPSRNRSGMLVIRLNVEGDLVWAYQYHVRHAEADSEQKLSDLDRDPRLSEVGRGLRFEYPQSLVVGSVGSFCTGRPEETCEAVGSAAFVASLDETSGNLLTPHALVSASRPMTFGETIVMNQLGETAAVGGEIAGDRVGSRQGFLALLTLGFGTVRQAMTHGASSGFNANVKSLDRWSDRTDSGYVFLMSETSAVGIVPTWLRSLVRTDRDGSTGACEQCAGFRLLDADVDQTSIQVALRAGTAEPFPVEDSPMKLQDKPCAAR